MDDSSVVDAVVKRERRTIAEKRRIVEQTMQSGVSVARIAQQHGINANQIFYWRHLYRRGVLQEKSSPGTNLLPVTISDMNPPVGGSGAICLELAKARVRIEGRVDERALDILLGHLLR